MKDLKEFAIAVSVVYILSLIVAVADAPERAANTPWPPVQASTPIKGSGTDLDYAWNEYVKYLEYKEYIDNKYLEYQEYIDNHQIITSTEHIFNGYKLILSNIPFKKGLNIQTQAYVEKQVGMEVDKFIDNFFKEEFIYFLCLIVAVYSFDIICNSFFDLFKPLLRERDQNYEIQRLRLSDKFIQIVGFSITFLQLYTTKFNGYWNNWAFFSIILHLSDQVLIHLNYLIVLYCYYPNLLEYAAFCSFYYIIVRRFGPDGVDIESTKSHYTESYYNTENRKTDIRITRNIMNIGYEKWYKHTIRWNINFAVTLSLVLHYMNFFTTHLKYMIRLSENTYESLNMVIALIWIYGLICGMLGHCAKVPLFNRCQESHVLVD